MAAADNTDLMTTLDDAWNRQDWDTFKKRHAQNVAVYWPGQTEPTRGREAHFKEGMAFAKAFPDNRVGNRPYLTLFGHGDWTCSVAVFTGTHKGPMLGPGGKTIPPTNKAFRLELCTVAKWKGGEIVEEKLFYDSSSMMRQLGLM